MSKYDDLFAEMTPEDSVFRDKAALAPLRALEEIRGRDAQERQRDLERWRSQGLAHPTHTRRRSRSRDTEDDVPVYPPQRSCSRNRADCSGWIATVASRQHGRGAEWIRRCSISGAL
ncbi:MAG: hypothetical protein V5A27_03920, partial [Halapricum sp.]